MLPTALRVLRHAVDLLDLEQLVLDQHEKLQAAEQAVLTFRSPSDGSIYITKSMR